MKRHIIKRIVHPKSEAQSVLCENVFSSPRCHVSLSGLGDGCGRLGVGAGLAPWSRLWGLGLFDCSSRHDLRGSGGQAAGSRADLQHCMDNKTRALNQRQKLSTGL